MEMHLFFVAVTRKCQRHWCGARKRAKSDTVSAKIIALDGDRISLSMKALENDIPDEEEDTYEIPDEFRADKEEKADESPFAKLLKGIKL